MKKSGFTLVELSIVLVIIGLLIGGILVGQSLINSAQIQSTVRTIQQFDAAISVFKGKYKALPGDAKGFGGDGNGFLNRATGDGQSGSYYTYFNNEFSRFWLDLQSSGFNYKGKKFTSTVSPGGINATGSANLLNTPTLDIGNKAVVMISENAGGPANPSVARLVYSYAIGDFSDPSVDWAAGNAMFGQPVMRPVDAAAIDSKIDDGKPATGSVNSGQGSEPAGVLCDTYSASGSDNQTIADSATYLLSNSGNVCALSIGLFGQELRRMYFI